MLLQLLLSSVSIFGRPERFKVNQSPVMLLRVLALALIMCFNSSSQVVCPADIQLLFFIHQHINIEPHDFSPLESAELSAG